MAKELWKGNEAIAEAAIRAGCRCFFGYPITPQNEIPEYFSRHMPEHGGSFVQAESEIAAINMVYGAACTGARVMTSTSSPGTSLMMEGISYIAATEVPMVLVDVVRGGPGLGTISPSQGDYNQMVHGGGHGEYHVIVLAPASVQEAVDLTGLAFDLAEKYRMVVCILMDGYLGQMMEPVELPPFAPIRTEAPSWAVGAKHPEGERSVLTSINISPPMQEIFNVKMMSRWQQIEKDEVRYKGYYLDDAEYVVVGYGTAGRIALTSVRAARAKGVKVGLLRPITVSPFPIEVLDNLVPGKKGVLVVEMNNGQMLDDVSAIVAKRVPVHFYGRMGGMVPYPDEIDAAIDEMIHGDHDVNRDARGAWLAKMRELVGTGA